MSTENSDFLLGLILDDNIHLNTIDFIDKDNKSVGYACMCVSTAIVNQFEPIRSVFTNTILFAEKYFTIYAAALDNYHLVTNNDFRQIYFDEANIYDLNLSMFPLKSLISDKNSKDRFYEFLANIQNNNSYAIILRDEIAYTIIHYQDDKFIIIDPHIEYSGIVSADTVYKYTIYNNIWDFDVYVSIPMDICNVDNCVTDKVAVADTIVL